MSTLTKEDELYIVRELVKDPDSYNFYAKIQKPQLKHGSIKTSAKLLIVGMFCGLFSLAFNIFVGRMWMPKYAENMVAITTNIAIWLGVIVMVTSFIYAVTRKLDLPDEQATDYAHKVVDALGLKDDCGKNVYSLIAFDINIGKINYVKKILADYQDLKVLKHRLLIAQNIEANGYQADNNAGAYILEREYAEKTQELLNRLYLLAQSRVNELVFALLNQDEYQYLPEHMRKGLIERFHNRLLKLVGSDD